MRLIQNQLGKFVLQILIGVWQMIPIFTWVLSRQWWNNWRLCIVQLMGLNPKRLGENFALFACNNNCFRTNFKCELIRLNEQLALNKSKLFVFLVFSYYLIYILASNTCKHYVQPPTCCISHATEFKTWKRTLQTHSTSNSHNFIHTYPNQVKQSEVESPKE